MSRISKVLYLCSVYRPNIGGVETTIDQLADNFKDKDIESVVLTKKYPFDLAEQELVSGSLVLRLNRPHSYQDYLSSIEFLRKKQAILKADVVHLIGVRRPMPLYGLMLSKFWQVPYVVTFAGGDIPDPHEPDSLLIWREGEKIAPQSIRQADKLTTFSRYTANLARLAMDGCTDIEVIYAGIDVNKIKKIKPHKEQFEYFFSARRLDYSKGLDILIKAYSSIFNQLAGVKLLIAGDGCESRALKDLTVQLGIEQEVVFLGELNHEQALSYMKGAVAHVCPSRAEGGGIVNYEAQACGCLAIGSDAGGIPEYIHDKETGLIFPSENVEALADLLLFPFRDRDKSKQIIAKAKKEISRKNWLNFSEKYLAIYNNLYANFKHKLFKPWSLLTDKMWRRLKA